MENYISVLKNSRLFAGLTQEEIRTMTACLGVKLRSFPKGGYVLRGGDEPEGIMVLVEGRLLIQRDDYWGKRSIINVIEPAEMFGEAYAGEDCGGITNDVLAVEDSVVAVFDVGRMLGVCPNGCSFHSLTVRNLFFAVCEKNRALVRKLGLFSQRSTREKLLAYLSEEASRQGKGEFSIPFDRQQLADFLAVDRSAMSRELCRLRDEGLISFDRSRFVLHRS